MKDIRPNFERWHKQHHRFKPHFDLKQLRYLDPMAQARWEGYQEGVVTAYMILEQHKGKSR